MRPSCLRECSPASQGQVGPRRRGRLRLMLFVLASSALAGETGGWRPELPDLRVPMRDGKWLGADVYLPAGSGRYPAVLIQTPYDRKRFGEPVGPQVSGLRARRQWPGIYDREHYAYVVVDWRGFHGSRAAAAGAGLPRRGLDGYDCVEWTASQPWCDGKVGTWGGSALGKQQFDTAAEHPPHLVCAVPLIACMGQMYEFYYTGGVLREAHVNTLKVLGYQIGNRVWDAPLPDSLVWTAAKRLTYRPEALDLPMLFVTGWWDHFPDEILTMFADVRSRAGAQARQDSRLIVGPWTHMGVDLLRQGGLEFPDAVDVEKAATMAFFDYWLRDQKANGRDRSPVVRYYQTADRQGGEGGRWVDAEAFPGEPVQDVRLFLHADGSISEQVAAAVDPQHPLTRSYRHDPRSPCLTLGGANLPPLPDGPTDHAALGQRSDLLVYSTGPLSSPLRVLGRMRATLAVVLDRPDADLVVRVCDQYPGKGAYLVADGIQRTKLRQGVPARLVEPGTPVEVTVRLPVTAYTFAVGHELKLFIGSADYPRFERNPHTGADHWDADTAVDVQVTIHHSREHPTSLVLPLGMGISPTRAGPARQGLTPRADP